MFLKPGKGKTRGKIDGFTRLRDSCSAVSCAGGGTHADYFSTIRHSEKRRRWRIHARGGREGLEIGEGARHRAVGALSGAIRGRQPNYGTDCQQPDYCVELPAASRPERSRRALGCPWRRGGASGRWVRHVLAVI